MGCNLRRYGTAAKWLGCYKKFLSLTLLT